MSESSLDISPRVGISSACWYPAFIEDSLTAVGECGFKTVELFVNAYSETQPDFRKKLLEIKERYGMNIVSIHPFSSFLESGCFFSNYERRWLDAFPFYESFINFAGAMGAKYFVLHGMKYPGTISVETYAERFRALSDAGKSCGVTVCHENVRGHNCADPDYMEKLRDAVGGDFATVLDVKQARRAGKDPFDFLRRFSGNIKHIHISDYVDEKRDCVPPYEGSFDVDGFVKAALDSGYGGSFIIELYSNGWSDVSQLKRSAEALSAAVDRFCKNDG